MTSAAESPGFRVPTVHKLGRFLDAFTPQRPRWRLAELSRELDWDLATTHRFAKVLVDIGMLGCDEQGVYEIGSLPLRLAAVSTSVDGGWTDLLHAIVEIAGRTALTTQIGVLDGRYAAIVASEEGRGDINAAARTGERLPLHATAAGKAILSQLTPDEVAAVLPERLEAFTEHTITDHDRLLDDVEAGREAGVWRVHSELSPGLDAVAVPVRRPSFGARPVALTCAGLSRELMPDRWDLAEATLRERFGARGDDGRGPTLREVARG